MEQENSNRRGYIYILINPAFPKYVKMGKTTIDPETRARQISSGTGVPAHYEVAWDAFVTDCDNVERIVHQKLAKHRSRHDREFFAIKLKEAISIVNNIVEPFICEDNSICEPDFSLTEELPKPPAPETAISQPSSTEGTNAMFRINESYLGMTRRMYLAGKNRQEIIDTNMNARINAGYKKDHARIRAKKDYGYILQESKNKKAVEQEKSKT